MLIPVFRLDTPADLGLKAIAFTLHGLNNRTPSAWLQRRLFELRADFDAERSLTRQQGFTALRRPGALPPSPQALLELYQARGRLPSVSPLIDLASQWSLNSGLSISAHDLKHLRLPVTLGMSRGGERFQMRHNLPPVILPAGEYVYFDGRGQVLSRMESLQSAATAVHADTRSALLIIQGHAQTDSDELYAVAEGLKADLQEYCCASLLRPPQAPFARLAMGH
ncbi:hypothetical protein KRX52_02315 [Pseudomonas sp. MAP12]|uniref:B3/B4 tRNA-binding domain-containing protein n=1 Tax=Geopseudomonas aromaticivorans TaxID=2849492 RepID=A0ABS6MTQ1_9GAMM|nr:phenylalanine--tRNA ligase beta subunit-related protein [Pseudomonas aromaticivorans]MBV2131627.1 hypothetical protein [Pseudomonas aromaticivorans]